MIRLQLNAATVKAMADAIKALFSKEPVSEALMDVEAMFRQFFRTEDAPLPPQLVFHLTPEQCNALAAFCRPEPVRLAEFHAFSYDWGRVVSAVIPLSVLAEPLAKDGTLELWQRRAGPFPDVARMLPSHCADLTPPAGQVPDWANDRPLNSLSPSQLDFVSAELGKTFWVSMILTKTGWFLHHEESGCCSGLPTDTTVRSAWLLAEQLDGKPTL